MSWAENMKTLLQDYIEITSYYNLIDQSEQQNFALSEDFKKQYAKMDGGRRKHFLEMLKKLTALQEDQDMKKEIRLKRYKIYSQSLAEYFDAKESSEPTSCGITT